MSVRIHALLALMLCWTQALAQDDPATVFRDHEEILHLDCLARPSRWGPSECTVTESIDLRADGRPTLHMHIPVDHHGGEKKYPIGWPRMYCELRQPVETEWRAFDRLQFEVYAKMSRPALPQSPLNFQMLCPDRHQAHYRNLAELELDKWVTIDIPLAKLEHLGSLARLGLNISESSYKHADVLDFFVGGFRLLRSAQCALTAMKIGTPALYQDAGELVVELEVVGPPERVSRGIPFTVRQMDRDLRRETLSVRRGHQVLRLDIAELELEPGEYTLVAFEADAKRTRSGAFRVVKTPWAKQ